MKHTPGPWRLEKGKFDWQLYGYDDYNISSFNIHDAEIEGNPELEKANAHLIAAAPVMLDALKEAHQAMDVLFAKLVNETDATFYPSKSGKPWEAIIKINEAIKKAEGGS